MQYSVTSDCEIVLVQGWPCVSRIRKSRIYEAKVNVTNLSSINSILHNFHPSLKSSLKNNNNNYEVSAFLFPQGHPDHLPLESLLSYYFSGHPLFRAIKIFFTDISLMCITISLLTCHTLIFFIHCYGVHPHQ